MFAKSARDQFLACAAFARNKHGDVLGGDATDRFVDVTHGWAGAEDLAAHFTWRWTGAGFARQAHLGGHLERLIHYPPQLPGIDRSEQILESPLFHRFDRRIRRFRSGDKNDRYLRVDAADLPVDFQSGDVGRMKIEKNDVRRVLADQLKPCSPGRHNVHRVRRARQTLAHLLLGQRGVKTDKQQTRSAI